jgi:hypothetical protein
VELNIAYALLYLIRDLLHGIHCGRENRARARKTRPGPSEPPEAIDNNRFPNVSQQKNAGGEGLTLSPSATVVSLPKSMRVLSVDSGTPEDLARKVKNPEI